MFRPNVVTNGLLMTGNKIKVVKKKKNSKGTSVETADNTMFAAPKKLSYNNPVAVQRRAEERSSQREQDQSAAKKRTANPMTTSELKGKVKDAEKFHKKAGKNRMKSTEQSFNRQSLATGGVRDMVQKAGETAQRDASACGQTSPCARKVYDKFKKGQGGKVGKAHDKLMKNK
jgi:hypothetical protein